jgi:uncharacterized membrane protein YbhN (UPF0104 family)
MPDEFSSRHLVRRLIGFAILIGIIAILVVSLPGLGTLRHRFGQADWRLLIVIGLLKFGSCLSNIVAFRDVFSRRMSWRFSYQLGMAEQATNVLLPTGGAGGLALGAWALHQGGMKTEHIARRSVAFFVLTSLPNFAVAAIIGPLLLTPLLHGHVPLGPTLAFSILAWLAALIVAFLPWILHRVRFENRTGRFADRLRTVVTSLEAGIHDVGELIVQRRWQAILGAFGYLGFDIAAMLVAFAAFGSHRPLGPMILGYVVGQLGGLIPLPGGIGGTDGGLIGAMVLYGSPLSTATAAVLAYRAFQVAVPAILGAIAFIGLRHTLTGTDTPHLPCSGLAEDAPEAAIAAALNQDPGEVTDLSVPVPESMQAAARGGSPAGEASGTQDRASDADASVSPGSSTRP